MKRQPLKLNNKSIWYIKIFSFLLVLPLLIVVRLLFNSQNNEIDEYYSAPILAKNSSPLLITTDIYDVQASSKNIINLSSEDISYYSTFSYEERVDILFNENYLLEDRINIFLGNDRDNVGLVYYDLTTGENICINENNTFIAASTYKVGLNLLFYYLESIGQVDLNEYIEFSWDDYEEGTGILQNYLFLDSFTIQELLDLSLIYSDNIATNMLGRYLGGHAKVRELLYDVLNIDFQSSENIITANIESEILKYIYLNIDKPNFSHMINVLTQTEFHDRLDLYIPQEIVAHKIGTYDTYIHDVGIILTDSPYILSIYTYNIENAEDKIALISKAIYLNK